MKTYTTQLANYAAVTSHLDLDEEGAYNRLITLYLSRGEALSSDRCELYRLARVSATRDKIVLRRILREFFDLESDGLWHHTGCDKALGDDFANRQRAGLLKATS